MSGEHSLAKQIIDKAIEDADESRSMGADTMSAALLGALVPQLAKHHSRKALIDLFEFNLEAIGEDEFVITRGS